MPVSGKCLCGSVEVQTELPGNGVGACHCGTCRTWGGGPYMSLEGTTAVTLSGEEHVRRFASSAWAERAFCSACGTHLFYRLNANGQYFLPAGLFELGDDADFDHQVFIEEKPPFYGFANKTRDLTGAELFAMYGATPEE
ncbi:MAG: GFA family protein [Pseudomonadota bacterium]